MLKVDRDSTVVLTHDSDQSCQSCHQSLGYISCLTRYLAAKRCNRFGTITATSTSNLVDNRPSCYDTRTSFTHAQSYRLILSYPSNYNR